MSDPLRPLRDRLRRGAQRQGVPLDVVEKDFALGHVLASIYRGAELADVLVFKGGTALKKAYFGDYRSADRTNEEARVRRPFLLIVAAGLLATLSVGFVAAAGARGGSTGRAPRVAGVVANGLATSQRTKAKNAATIENIHILQIAIQSWAVDHNDRYPRASLVRRGTKLRVYIDSGWPRNPWNHKPMRPGRLRGRYTYKRFDDGRFYRLVGHLARGKKYVVP